MSKRVLLLVTAVLLVAGACDDERTPAPRADPRPAPTWVRAADSPLSPRYDALAAWLDGELVVLGGRDARCPRSRSYCRVGRPARRDGAAYDPATDTWRSIPRAPGPVGDGVVVGGLLVVSSLAGMHAYDPAADTWEPIRAVFQDLRIRKPARMASDGRHLLLAGDGGSFGLSDYGQSCSIRTHRCRQLPESRVMHAASLVATPEGPAWVGSTSHSYFFNGPNRVSIFRGGRWHSAIVPGSTPRRPIRPTLLVGDRLVALDAGDDGPVGSFDVSTGDWHRLHPPGRSRDLPSLRAVGDGWLAAGGWLLSPADQWTQLGHPPGAEARWLSTGAMADGHLYVYGGADFSQDTRSRPTGELWIRTLP